MRDGINQYVNKKKLVLTSIINPYISNLPFADDRNPINDVILIFVRDKLIEKLGIEINELEWIENGMITEISRCITCSQSINEPYNGCHRCYKCCNCNSESRTSCI